MKKTIVIILICLLIIITTSCNNRSTINDKERFVNDNNSSKEPTVDVKIEEEEEEKEEKEENKASSIGGGSDGCTLHNFGYHFFPTEISDYLDNDEFSEWLYNTNGKYNELIPENSECSLYQNIFSCKEYFNIPDDVIIKAYINNLI